MTKDDVTVLRIGQVLTWNLCNQCEHGKTLGEYCDGCLVSEVWRHANWLEAQRQQTARERGRVMKQYICDECGDTLPEAPITVNGVAAARGHILLPDRFHENHLCSLRCFCAWAEDVNREFHNRKRGNQ